MKIVQTPPKTGEEFIVAWFDNGESNAYSFWFDIEFNSWVRRWPDNLPELVSDERMEKLIKNALIIIEG